MNMFQVSPEQKRQALSMAALQAGAGMMDRRGTYGNFGTAFNRGVQQGMGTYIPMMMFAQQSQEKAAERKRQEKREKKEDRRYRDSLMFKQMGMELDQQQMDQLADYRSQQQKNWQGTFDLNRQKFAYEKKQNEAAKVAALADRQAKQQFIQNMFGQPGIQPAPPGPYESMTTPSVQGGGQTGMFGGMTPEAKMMAGSMYGLPPSLLSNIYEKETAGGRELKAADTNAINRTISNTIGGEWDTLAGKWVTKDPFERQKNTAIAARAAQIYRQRPGIGHDQAVQYALKDFNIELPKPGEQNPEDMASDRSKPSNFLGTYVPGQGFVR